MINVLLIDEELEHCKKIINNINKEYGKFNICAIANNDSEISYILSNYNIDIILLNSNFERYKILIEKEIIFQKKYVKSVILIGANYNIDLRNNIWIYDIVRNKNDIEEIINLLNECSLFKQNVQNTNYNLENNIKEKIERELKYLEYNFSHKGTRYLLETIYMLYNLKDYYDDNLSKDIYPVIGKKFGKSSNNIKCCIRYATEIMTYECDEKKLTNYLYDYSYIKPGTKRVISAILGKLNNKYI